MKVICLFALLASLSFISAERYIITYEDDAWHALQSSLPENTVYNLKNLKMTVADLSANEMFMYEAIPGVAVYKDSPVYLFNENLGEVQKDVTWGIDRTDQAKLPLDKLYHYTNTASDVDVYVIDTGVMEDHREFGGRAKFEVNFAGDKQDTDCNGHGTHVSSTIAGKTVGIAKEAKIHAVKALNCAGSGQLSSVVAAIDWVVGAHKNKTGAKSVINMSIGGPNNKAVVEAVEAAYQAGIAVVVAAGNSGADACTFSPANAPNAITVAASNIRDVSAVFTNKGKCVDLYAPGVNILGASFKAPNGYITESGTSMASPHTAGVAALLLSSGAAKDAAEVKTKLTSLATKDVLKRVPRDTPNLLLFIDAASSSSVSQVSA